MNFDFCLSVSISYTLDSRGTSVESIRIQCCMSISHPINLSLVRDKLHRENLDLGVLVMFANRSILFSWDNGYGDLKCVGFDRQANAGIAGLVSRLYLEGMVAC